MRQLLAGISNCPAALAVALLAVAMAPSSPDVALSDASGSDALTSAAPTPASRIRRSAGECDSGSAERRAARCRGFLGLASARRRSVRFLRQVQLAAHLRTRRRHAWHRGSWLARSTVVAPDRRQERCRLSLWSSRPRRMESLPADQRQDHLGPEPLARDGELRGPIR